MTKLLLGHSFRQRIVAVMVIGALAVSGIASADDYSHGHGFQFLPGNLVVSRSVYDNKSSNIAVGTILASNCANTTGGCGAATGAPYDGSYP